MTGGRSLVPADSGSDGADSAAEGARRAKSAAAFRTISEVSADLDVPQHVLRFWESRFPQLRPLKRGGGRRYYRPEDVELLRRIRTLLWVDGYKIEGVQRLLRGGRADPELDGDGSAPPSTPRSVPGTSSAPDGQPPITAARGGTSPNLFGSDAADTLRRQELRALAAELRAIRAILGRGASRA